MADFHLFLNCTNGTKAGKASQKFSKLFAKLETIKFEQKPSFNEFSTYFVDQAGWCTN